MTGLEKEIITPTTRILKKDNDQRSDKDKRTIINKTLDDPILSRLRLNDQFGKPIDDLKNFFRDCKVVGFFFGSIWKHQMKSSSSLENNILEFSRRNPHRFKCIFVSVDSNRNDFDQVTRDKPWISMIWNDGSNEDEKDPTSKPEEEFLTPMDDKVLKKILKDEISLKEDSRPISRVGLCHGLEVFYSPTLKIYHLGSKTWLDLRVRNEILNSDEVRAKTWEKWERGEKSELTLTEILVGLKWLIVGITFGLGYMILISFDESYKILNLVELYLNQKNNDHQSTNSNTNSDSYDGRSDHQKVGGGGGGFNGHEYVEF